MKLREFKFAKTFLYCAIAFAISCSEHEGDPFALGFDMGPSMGGANDPSTAIVLSSNVWANGYFGPFDSRNNWYDDRQQWFRFMATSSTQYIHFAPGGMYDVNVVVYTSGMSNVCSRNLYGSTLWVECYLNPGTMYYIEVRPYYDDNFGNYRIAFNSSPSRP